MVPGFVIKLLSFYVKRHLHDSRESVSFSGNLAISTVHVLGKVNPSFYSETQSQMLLLVSVRHVGAQPDGLQQGMSTDLYKCG